MTTHSDREWAGGPAAGTEAPRRCGFSFTTTGRPCRNLVAPGAPWCRAGHPCTPPSVPDDMLAVALDRSGVHPGGGTRRPRRRGRTGRATELLRQAMASDDAERLGLCAEHVLAEPDSAMVLLGDPTGSHTARQAVVQRFGRVGALLVLGYEERAERVRVQSERVRVLSVPDPGAECLERLLREFRTLDAPELFDLLAEIDRRDGRGDDRTTEAHRWLDATYAVAARDGTLAAHHAYMRALDVVMRLVRPLVAS